MQFPTFLPASLTTLPSPTSPLSILLLLCTALYLGLYSYLYKTLKQLFLAKVKSEFIKEMRKTANGAKITVGAVYLNLVDGVFEARDIVVHTPGMEEWGWQSPLLGRCGVMRVTFAFLSCIPYQRYLRYEAKEIYSVKVRDCQVFVEKKANVFNFMLCDAMYDLPDPKTLPTNDRSSESTNGAPPDVPAAPSTPPPPASPKSKADEKANKIVKLGWASVLRAGKVAEKDKSVAKGVEVVLNEQKKGIMRVFEEGMAKYESGQGLEDMFKEGQAVLKSVGKAVEKNMTGMKKSMEMISKPPPIRKDYKPKPEKDLFRVGSVTIQDMRVFTRNMLAKEKASKENTSGWHKPLVFKEVVISGAELSSPSGILNAKGTAPRIGMHSKEIIRVMEKRMKAETAKTNSGVLMSTALGEMSEYLKDTGFSET
jgi:hypothetical protein